MSPQLEITRTVPFFPHGVFLQWDVKGATEVGTYLFEVSRSGGLKGPWTVLGTVTNTFNYRDILPTTAENDPNQLSLVRGIYYRVKLTLPSSAVVETVSIVEPKLDGRHRLLKRKILRDQSIALRKLNGLEVAVLKRMHWGPRCTKCYDPYTQVSTRSGCTTCYGTTFSPGYFDPVITLARPTTPVTQTQLSEQGTGDQADSVVTLLDAPRVEKDDILVFLSDNRRFIVKQPVPGALENVTLFQRLQVSELPRSSIEYRLQVDPLRTPPLF
jgi:hypothetical protein